MDVKTPRGIVTKFIEPEFESEEVVSERIVDPEKEKEPGYSDHGNGKHAKVKKAIEAGYTGDICPECQSLTMVRNGTCLKCMTCGSTTGCS